MISEKIYAAILHPRPNGDSFYCFYPSIESVKDFDECSLISIVQMFLFDSVHIRISYRGKTLTKPAWLVSSAHHVADQFIIAIGSTDAPLYGLDGTSTHMLRRLKASDNNAGHRP